MDPRRDRNRRRRKVLFVVPAGPIALQPATMRTLAFLSGLGLTIREALLHGPERPSLYVLFAGMMTGAFVIGQSGRIGGRQDEEEGEDDDA